MENRNHWRRDASRGEERTRWGHARALMNLALLRRANLRRLAADGSEDWLPTQKEHRAANPVAALALVRAKS